MDASKILVLVPIDFSEQSLVTLKQAHNLALVYKGEIMLLHVFEHSGLITRLFSNESANYELKKQAQEKLEKLAEETANKEGVITNAMIIEGIVHEEILSSAERLNATLIVMSTLESGGLKKRFIATNTLRVVKESPCPVITIKGSEHREGCENIVVPLDLTKQTTQKVHNALEFVKLFEGTTIRLVSILETRRDKKVGQLEQQMEDVKHYIETKGVDCKAEFVRIIKGEDTLAEAIIGYAEKVKADLIMIMTQQENNPTEFFIGSSAQSIINNSDIPVMSVVPKASVKGEFF